MDTKIWTPEAEERLTAYLETHELSYGVGSPESACSIAAINLAMTGELTDKIPDCMSLVLGKWIIRIQDKMPSEVRNSPEWKRLLPLAAGTGREREPERFQVILNHMWESLSLAGSTIDKLKSIPEWKAMCGERTSRAAGIANYAIGEAENSFADNELREVGKISYGVVYAAAAASPDLEAAYGIDNTECRMPGTYAAADAARAASCAAEIAGWQQVDPVMALARIIHLDDSEGK